MTTHQPQAYTRNRHPSSGLSENIQTPCVCATPPTTLVLAPHNSSTPLEAPQDCYSYRLAPRTSSCATQSICARTQAERMCKNTSSSAACHPTRQDLLTSSARQKCLPLAGTGSRPGSCSGAPVWWPGGKESIKQDSRVVVWVGVRHISLICSGTTRHIWCVLFVDALI